MKVADCIECEEEYSDKRLELGYMTCLDCGQAAAANIIRSRNRRVLAEIAPAAAAGAVVTNEAPDWDAEFGTPPNSAEEVKDGQDA